MNTHHGKSAASQPVALHDVLLPRSIAVVGASDDTSKFGGRAFTYLVRGGYTGDIYPVNPKYSHVLGYTCYPTLLDIPVDIDACEIVVPRPAVPAVLEQAATKNIKLAVVISTGFSETGREEDRLAEGNMLELAHRSGFRILGPNCLGVINTHERLVLSTGLSLGAGPLRAGRVGIISQSGALMATLIGLAQDMNLGLSHLVSTGNQSDLEIADFLEVMVNDPKTDVIGIYMEGMLNPERFCKLAKRARILGKPIIVLKVGSSDKGVEMAATHTGSLAGRDEVFQAIFRQLGIIRVNDLGEMLDALYLFERCRAEVGPNLALLTSSGGMAGIAADLCDKFHINLPDFAPKTVAKLREVLDVQTMQSAAHNPLDMLATPMKGGDRPIECIRAVAADPNVDIVFASFQELVPPYDSFVDRLLAGGDLGGKPLVFSISSGAVSREATNKLRESSFPVFRWLDEALQAIKYLMDYHVSRRACLERGDSTLETPHWMTKLPELKTLLLRQKPGLLSAVDTAAFLSLLGVPVARQALAGSAEEAVKLAEVIGYPVALKLASSQVAHKSDVGGVRLDLERPDEVADAYAEMIVQAQKVVDPLDLDGIVVQKMVRGVQLETIVGLSHDEMFGPVTLFGMGGVYVEILRDFVLWVGHLTRTDAIALISETKGQALFRGARGYPPADISALADTLVTLADVGHYLGSYIEAVDLNPLIVLPEGQGVCAVDARIYVRGTM
jgi:acetate---CoA ligase (ADP-forming)